MVFSSSHPVWQTAFRSFFLLGSLHFVAAVTVWLLFLTGNISIINYWWHPYEMVFGFARAIIIGFMFTAAQNWTGKVLVSPRSISVFALLWLAGRFAIISLPWLGYLFFAADMVLNIWMIVILVKAFAIPQQKHNHILWHLTVLLSLFQLLAFLSIGTKLINGPPPSLWLHAGLLVVLLYVVVIAGRVVPFFTGNVLPQAGARRSTRVEAIILKLSLLLPFTEILPYLVSKLNLPAEGIGAYIVPATKYLVVTFLAALAVVHFIRWSLWNSFKTLKLPIVWILHFAYVMLPIGLIVFILHILGVVQPSVTWHVLGLGFLTLFILGMITRVALGHTGRVIKASKRMVTAYIMVFTAMVIRISASLWPNASDAYITAAILGGSAFLLFLIQYIPYLIGPRPDGKRG